ncbi:MAG TPA: hypothetical protein PLX58_02325 [Smithellaceae bacterium]|nr:hypothetical protein [Smithellaceae bacterium]HQF83787.1 hypothetical protein [Smithellaceae bacterium]HQG79904.1 hypothetical protein [Smithellaceae bacterium]
MRSNLSQALVVLLLLVGVAVAAPGDAKQPVGQRSTLNQVKNSVKSAQSGKLTNKKQAVWEQQRTAIPSVFMDFNSDYGDLPFYRSLNDGASHPTDLLFAPGLADSIKQESAFVFFTESAVTGNNAKGNGTIYRPGSKDNLTGPENTPEMDFAPYKYENKYKDNLFSLSLPIPATGSFTILPTVSYLLREDEPGKSKGMSMSDFTEGELFYGGVNLMLKF